MYMNDEITVDFPIEKPGQPCYFQWESGRGSFVAKMGAEAVKHGDAGYRFNFIGDYQMQILIWQGDDEFPPNAQVLYSDNFADGFAAEDRVVAGDILISTIKANM